MIDTVLWLLGTAAVAYVLAVGSLWLYARRRFSDWSLGDAVRLVPDILRMLRRWLADPGLPRGVRLGIALLIGYLLSPIDLIPDIVPILGYADDAVIVAIVLRFVVRKAGPEVLSRSWSGSAEGLDIVKRLAGLDVRSPPTT